MRRLIATTAVTAMLALPTLAADLGGNCCADLEERIAELEAVTVKSGNRKMQLVVSGHVAHEVIFHDIEGADRPNVSFSNAGHTTTRFRLNGTSRISSEWSAGFAISIAVGGFGEGGESLNELSVRKSNLWVRSQALGTFRLGLQSLPTDGIVEIDLGHTGTAATMTGVSPLDLLFFGESIAPWDGGRKEAVSWKSADLAGFRLSAAWVSEDHYEAALRYAAEFGQFKAAMGIGYRRDDGPFGFFADSDTIGGSGSIMHTPTGLFVSGSYSRIDLGGEDVHLDGWEARGGIRASQGKGLRTTFYGRYFQTESDALFDGEKPTVYGGGLIVDIDALALQVYGAWDHIDDKGLVLDQEEDVFRIGAKVRF